VHEPNAAGGQLRSGSALPSLTPCTHCDLPAIENLQKLLDTTRQPILGSAFSGAIADLGKGVQGFAVGDPVCGMTGTRMGAHAEYLAASQNQLVIRPTLVSDEQAAGVLFGGLTALHFLRARINIKPGMSILVVGASGAVGTNAVQIARLLGARVTAVTSCRNMALRYFMWVTQPGLGRY
jgi:NADPH:quinone reductase-like Zn-dependent oxidoreductase